MGTNLGNTASKDLDDLNISPMQIESEKPSKQMILTSPPRLIKGLTDEIEKLLYSDEKIISPPRPQKNHQTAQKTSTHSKNTNHTSNDKIKKELQTTLKQTPERKGRNHHKHVESDHEMVEVHEEKTQNKRQRTSNQNHHSNEKQ